MASEETDHSATPVDPASAWTSSVGSDAGADTYSYADSSALPSATDAEESVFRSSTSIRSTGSSGVGGHGRWLDIPAKKLLGGPVAV